VFRFFANLFKGTKAAPIEDDLAAIQRQQTIHLLARETIEAGELFSRYPPQVSHAKKQLLFDVGLARGLHGSLTISRYGEVPLPNVYLPYTPTTEIVGRKGYFKYSADSTSEDWFMNFAHHDAFHGYGHFMFAQDEIQVAEHPALACAREMMLTRTDKLQPKTAEGNSPTPLLIRSVERTMRVDTRAIYGARFARADESTIRESLHAIDPPTRSNIVAIEAPIGTGNRTYTCAEVEAALRTAFSGFRAVVLESRAGRTSNKPIVLHTGNWGCGAYGGNRQLMISVQIMAAALAGISQAIFYCGPDDIETIVAFESELLRRFGFRPGVAIDRVLDRLTAASFPWSSPDGN
jgi:hypothetical protein